jgi:hypothetical protein
LGNLTIGQGGNQCSDYMVLADKVIKSIFEEAKLPSIKQLKNKLILHILQNNNAENIIENKNDRNKSTIPSFNNETSKMKSLIKQE